MTKVRECFRCGMYYWPRDMSGMCTPCAVEHHNRYQPTEPEALPGLWLLLAAAVGVLLAAMLGVWLLA